MLEPKNILQYTQNNRTPFYLYDLNALRSCLSRCKSASAKYGFHVHYAIKANSEKPLLEVFRGQDFGVDCVTGQEVEMALSSEFDPSRIAFAGVGKSDWEIDLAINAEIFTLNVESLEELVVINERAGMLKKKANVAFRLNPNISAKTHHYITTGLEENKFGISEWQLPELFELLPSLENIEVRGLHFHIGSQIIDLEPFRNLCNRIHHFIRIFQDHGYEISHVNAGGGLGFDYTRPDDDDNPNFERFFETFHNNLNLGRDMQLHFELGRSLVASCSDLIAKALYVKKGRKINFLILDAGMTELLRPALYQAFHHIENISKRTNVQTERYDVVGPICESSDCFGKAVELNEVLRGDFIRIRSVGAYGACMSSEYNMRKANPAVFVDE